MHCNIVAERLERLARKGVVDAFGLLQADDVGLPLGEPGGQIIHSLLDGIDVPGGDAHADEARARGCRVQLRERVRLRMMTADVSEGYGEFTMLKRSPRMRQSIAIC